MVTLTINGNFEFEDADLAFNKHIGLSLATCFGARQEDAATHRCAGKKTL